MNFGGAIEHIKKGGRAARSGWNGKGMFIYLNKGAIDGEPLGLSNPIPENHGSTIDGVSLSLFEVHDKGTSTRLPNLNMNAASGNTVTGWLASQTDILAEDWVVVD